ncbi:MAG: hypothetical protein K0S12_387 [Bacteroidetes bacterium]|nr:hypothetical protein [Bacteroidota bacterium]
MKTKLNFLFAGLMAVLGLNLSAQQNSGSQTFQVLGNCGMCKKTIETAALKSGASKAQWNEQTKLLSVKFNPKKVKADQILKAVAYAGYDNEKYLAPSEAYDNLHECCKYERPKIKQSATSHSSHVTTHSTAVSPETKKKNELEQVYDKYFDLKDALVKSDQKAAAQGAKELVTALDAVNMNAMKEKEHNAFMKQFAGLKSDAKNISDAKDLERQRDVFAGLSDKMFELMKVAKPSYPVYLENCPMFNDGKGANWISKETAIKNPYYGSQMLTCGKVKETLK